MPITAKVCSYTTLQNELSNFYVFNKQYWFYFHNTSLFSIPTVYAYVNSHGGQLEHLL